MSGSRDYIQKIKDFSTLDFSDNELQTFRESISILYKLLKKVFDSPRILPRYYNTVYGAMLSREKIFQSPDDFYRFICDNVVICIRFRAKSRCYSVGVLGWNLTSENYKKFPFVDYVESKKDLFSQGFTYYGHFTRDKFYDCVKLYFQFVKYFTQTELDNALLLI